jgi:hypothetical protein
MLQETHQWSQRLCSWLLWWYLMASVCYPVVLNENVRSRIFCRRFLKVRCYFVYNNEFTRRARACWSLVRTKHAHTSVDTIGCLANINSYSTINPDESTRTNALLTQTATSIFTIACSIWKNTTNLNFSTYPCNLLNESIQSSRSPYRRDISRNWMIFSVLDSNRGDRLCRVQFHVNQMIQAGILLDIH